MPHPDSPLKYIYALKSGTAVRYVGNTTRTVARFSNHRHARTPLGDWVRSTDAKLVVLEILPWRTYKTQLPGWRARERHWVQHFATAGHDLFNVHLMPKAA